MNPEDIGYTTDLDGMYAEELNKVVDGDSFEMLIENWGYWLDDDIKKMTGKDWATMAQLIKDCRTEGVIPEDKHNQAIALLMPERIFKVSIEAQRFGAPWGCAYIRMKEMKMIKY